MMTWASRPRVAQEGRKRKKRWEDYLSCPQNLASGEVSGDESNSNASSDMAREVTKNTPPKPIYANCSQLVSTVTIPCGLVELEHLTIVNLPRHFFGCCAVQYTR